jgi:hypothetical protein
VITMGVMMQFVEYMQQRFLLPLIKKWKKATMSSSQCKNIKKHNCKKHVGVCHSVYQTVCDQFIRRLYNV